MSPWDLEDGSDRRIWLLTVSEYRALPPGTRLIAIDGEVVTKPWHPHEQVPEIDLDTRYGHIAYGVEEPL